MYGTEFFLPNDPVFDTSDKAHFEFFIFMFTRGTMYMLVIFFEIFSNKTHFYDRDKSKKDRFFDFYPFIRLFNGFYFSGHMSHV